MLTLIIIVLGLTAGYFTGSWIPLALAAVAAFFAYGASLERRQTAIRARAAARPPETPPAYVYTPSALRTLVGWLGFGIPGAIVGHSWYKRRRVR